MCGRYTLSTPPDQLATAFGIPDPPDTPPRYNVAPSQLVAVVGLKPDGKTRGLAKLKWGFVPSWANDPDSGPRPINAKAETVAAKPPFEHAFREGRRCLIPADGFFEWAAEGGKKVPHHFRLKTREPFAFAGVWDAWAAGGKPLLTCAIITVPANDLVRPFHDRMPAVLRPEDYAPWLDHGTPVPALLGMLAPFPAGLMEAVKLAPTVNNVRNDGPECLTPAA